MNYPHASSAMTTPQQQDINDHFLPFPNGSGRIDENDTKPPAKPSKQHSLPGQIEKKSVKNQSSTSSQDADQISRTGNFCHTVFAGRRPKEQQMRFYAEQPERFTQRRFLQNKNPHFAMGFQNGVDIGSSDVAIWATATSLAETNRNVVNGPTDAELISLLQKETSECDTLRQMRTEYIYEMDSRYEASLINNLKSDDTWEPNSNREEIQRADAEFVAVLEQKIREEEVLLMKQREAIEKADAEFAAALEQKLNEHDNDSRQVIDNNQRNVDGIRNADTEFAILLQRRIDEENAIELQRREKADAELASRLQEKLREEEALALISHQKTLEEDARLAVAIEKKIKEEEALALISQRKTLEEDGRIAAAIEQKIKKEEALQMKCREETRKADGEFAAAIEQKLKAEADLELKAREKARKLEEHGMSTTYNGAAWRFVHYVQEVYRTKLQKLCARTGIDSNQLDLVAVDDMYSLAQNLLMAQNAFKRLGKPCMVDVGYHYTRAENLNNIRENGLLTHEERKLLNISSYFNGSVYGDGIYTANDPYAFHGKFGNTGIIVARLIGDVTSPRRKKDWPISMDSKIINDMVILKESSQCIPIVKFSSSIIDKRNKTRQGNYLIYLTHCVLREIIDKFFNDGQIKNNNTTL